ncbi:hypothetical protein QMK38_19500 [Lysinibacillus fusiformis]|nr:hypothetical protein [Lysinibacillus fusiformis]
MKRLSNGSEIPIIGLGVSKMTNPEETHNLCLIFDEKQASIIP